ncbi:MAG TPA: hypothetical protein VMF51_13815 [Nocardioides sp.]|uniref:hypothetical protein n=1 Tax=Nocardioides sp. TaxID=35761 RepID=UPI002C0DB7EA|nr:hypothetical protein [Nocardioides sp.]HTW16207.1 hypothetical protein [Nocardioides sp.]
MPDPDPQAHDREDDVRRLLAEARHDGPVPVNVAARLDRVLEQLAAVGPVEVVSEQEPAEDLDDLDAHRRRRRARNLLLAAAAVVVVGVGLGQLGGPATDSGSDGSAAGGSSYVTTSDADASEAVPQDESLPSAENYSGSLAKRLRAPEPTSPRPVVVRDRDFASTDRLRALRELSTMTRSLGSTVEEYPADARAGDRPMLDSAGRASWYACKSGPYGEGHLVAVQYDAHPAVLAIRPATGDSTVVELLRCGSGAVLRSATVPLS